MVTRLAALLFALAVPGCALVYMDADAPERTGVACPTSVASDAGEKLCTSDEAASAHCSGGCVTVGNVATCCDL